MPQDLPPIGGYDPVQYKVSSPLEYLNTHPTGISKPEATVPPWEMLIDDHSAISPPEASGLRITSSPLE